MGGRGVCSMKDLVVKTGEYQNQQGETKAEWTKVGVILSNQNGEYALLDPAINLAGVLQKQNALAIKQRKEGNEKARTGTSVMCSIFDKSQDGGQQQGSQTAPQGGGDIDDSEIPF